MSWWACRAHRAEQGAAPIELALGVGLVLLPLALLVLTLPPWVQRQSAAQVAAREAARAAVLADAPGAAVRAAEAAVRRTAANHAIDPGRAEVQLSGELARGAVIRARVALPVPATPLPGLGAVGGFTVTAEHAELVDRYRSLGAGP